MARRTIVVCGPHSHFADDVHTTCATCGAGVVHRPHAPAGVRVCMRCANAEIALDPATVTVTITDETRREVALYLAKTEGKH